MLLIEPSARFKIILSPHSSVSIPSSYSSSGEDKESLESESKRLKWSGKNW